MDSDLTTDACPKPPREEPSTKTNDDVSNEQNRQQSDNNSIKNTARLKTKRNPIPKPPSNFAYANVINIVNSENVHVGKKTTYTYTSCNKHQKENPPADTIGKTKEIEMLLECEKPLEREHILFISEHIAHWKDIARRLDYSEGQIHQFYENYHAHGVKEVIYQFLLDWMQNEPDKATLSKLAEILWATEQRDATLRLAKKVFV